ncbi:single-stranded DNA-binding protein [Rhinolophus gammaherpesvirus 1]|uniref:Single-stranded DNA-binding protein n=1 Tax=Rhinolophus gammaherpesvirus 1 TaxID=2054179 RepID=A0A2Z5U695_9GAMA|nr:single-stranded DNA-binding protein [Rhinolophus gammaherpesvirus 1]BBB06455.1 single-stranded DNA-binding protein [Rhinolophus gammaherpesvirus 1]
MNSKTSSGPVEENVGTKAPIGPCGFLYFYQKDGFPVEEASLLGNLHHQGTVFSLPLLFGLTVEPDFQLNVKAVHKKLDMATVTARATTYHREVIVFKNVSAFKPIFHGPGIEALCASTRKLFGFSEFQTNCPKGEIFDLNSLGQYIPNLDSSIGAVIVTESFKERLYSGNLVPVQSQIQLVQIGQCEAYKIPLYDVELFSRSPDRATVKQFYSADVSKYLYESHFTSLAQGLRVKDVTKLAQVLEKQSVNDQYKLPKVYVCREFPINSQKNSHDSALMIVDSAATELAVSYGLSFMEVPQEGTACLNYDRWPIFEHCENQDQRLEALKQWNAKQAIHVHAQLFATNSVLYLTRVHKLPSPRGTENVYNSMFLQHGLALLNEPTQKENGLPSFAGIPLGSLPSNNYSIQHLVYAASFSPQILARQCYYLQFAQHHRSSTNQSYNVPQYVGNAANSPMCEECGGKCPGSCINTLFYRLADRFPPVVTPNRRDPYVVTGVTGAYNDLDIAGNFASFREKDEENPQTEEYQKYTYWQVTQTILDKLSEMGICDGTEDAQGVIDGISSFLKVFKDIDQTVDTEATKFINSMVKNNVNFRENIKSIHHILQYACNVYWQPPCSVFLNFYYRCILTLLQDISLPICMMYEQENPAVGVSPGEWLKMHYQTLWTNFKNACIDKGVLTGTEYKVIHKEPFSDFFDVDAAIKGEFMPVKIQVKLSRALITAPKMIKIKNRIMFSNSAGTESIQAAFVKPTSKNDNYIVSGPYMKFLNSHHSRLFPGAKISPLFLWHTFSKRRQMPVMPNVPKDLMMELASYIDYNSKMHDDTSIIDITPDTFYNYAKIRLNNAIFRACGQTQFYATTLHCLTPKLHMVSAEEYPHVIESLTCQDTSEYLNLTKDIQAPSIQCTSRESICEVGRHRPIVTVPLVVNKYTGITGNSQIFQCANLGYFIGRGVDKALIPDSLSYKKQGSNSGMRKRHVFMTPLTDHILKRVSGSSSVTFEIESVRRRVQQILEDSQNPCMLRDVVIQLVKSLGQECGSLTPLDLEYYLGQYYIFADDISDKLQMLSDSGGPWTEEWALSVLGEENPDQGEFEFVSLDEQLCQAPIGEDSTPQVSVPSATVAKKRKITAILGDLDI